MDTWMVVLMVALVLVAAGAIAWSLMERRRSASLKSRFGPEYDRTLESTGSRRRAEADLLSRAKRVESLDIRTLSTEDYDRFSKQWKSTQALFVDSPAAAVADAERLVQQVMRARGYPMGDFDRRAADISVDHPSVVENYRSAREIALASQSRAVRTEDMRQAMVHYRILFEDLLETDRPKSLGMTG